MLQTTDSSKTTTTTTIVVKERGVAFCSEAVRGNRSIFFGGWGWRCAGSGRRRRRGEEGCWSALVGLDFGIFNAAECSPSLAMEEGVIT